MEEIDVKFPVGEDGERIDGDTLDKVDNKKIRFALYRAFTYQRYGFLGKGNRIQLGSCVENKIKELFPSEDNAYVGFRPSFEQQLDDDSF